MESLSIPNLLESGKWKRSLFTTFTLSLGYFEAYILPRLHRAGCDDITILVDQRFYLQSLYELNAGRIGTDYRVLPISMRSGFFHGKTVYLQGEGSQDTLAIGSGNLTLSGGGKNLECLDVVTSTSHAVAFSQYGELITALCSRSDTISEHAKDVLSSFQQRAVEMARLGNDGGDVWLLNSLVTPISDQIVSIIEQSRCSRLVCLSPFHDPQAMPIKRLAKKLGIKDVQLGIDEHDNSTPVAAGVKEISFCRRKGAGDPRPLHAKWYEFRGTQNWLLCGSVNATHTSLETTKNFEVSTLRKVGKNQLAGWEKASDIQFVLSPVDDALTSDVIPLSLSLEGAERVHGTFVTEGNVDGMWEVIEVSSELERAVGTVAVKDRKFQMAFSKSKTLSQTEACQVLLRRGATHASGWLMYEEILAQGFGERDLGRKLNRLRDGSGTEDDILEVLSWITGNLPALGGESFGWPDTKSAPNQESETGTPHEFDPSHWQQRFKERSHTSQGLFGTFSTALSLLSGSAMWRGPAPGESAIGGDVDEFKEDALLQDLSGKSVRSSQSVEQSLQKFKLALEDRLEVSANSPSLTRFCLEGLLLVHLIALRTNTESSARYLPLHQWAHYADSVRGELLNDTTISGLILSAMACAWSLGAEKSDAAEAIARTARRSVAQNSTGAVLEEARKRILTSAQYSILHDEERKTCAQSLDSLLAYRGNVAVLEKFIVEWKNSAGLAGHGASPPVTLGPKTRDMFHRLNERRVRPDQICELRGALPASCPQPCGNPFDASDRAVLRNARGLECLRCHRFLFWLGDD